jgi:O-antigen/teichoic acid export membrane protein
VTDGTARPQGQESLVRSGAVLAITTGAGNVLAYVTTVVLSRALGPAAYGAVAALVGLALIASVPALALQLVAARSVVSALSRDGRGGLAPLTRHLLALGAGVGVAVAAVCVAASAVLAQVLHLGSPLAVVATAVAVALITVTAVLQGMLQGEERFGALGTVVLVGWTSRLVAAVACVAADVGVTGVMSGMAAATAAQLGVAIALHAAGTQRARLEVSGRRVGRILAARRS